MMPPHAATADLHAARDYSTIEIGKASTIVWIAILGLMVALSYPVAATSAIVGLVGGLVASRVWQTGGLRPTRSAVAAGINHVARYHDRPLKLDR
jgi:membrane associated rhomboid family serine protease